MPALLRLGLLALLCLSSTTEARPLEAGDILVGDENPNVRFVLRQPMGSGAFAHTFLATDTHTNEELVLKPFATSTLIDDAGITLIHTYGQLSFIDHPNIVRVQQAEAVHLLADGEKYLVIPMKAANDSVKTMGPRLHLKSNLPRLDSAVSEIARLMDHLIGALEAFSDRELVHYDLHPGNVLLGKDGFFKAGDLDFVRGRLTAPPPFSWEPEWGPIEYDDERIAHLSGTAGDFWTACSTGYFALTGNSPLEDFARVKYEAHPNIDKAVGWVRDDLAMDRGLYVEFERMVAENLKSLRKLPALSPESAVKLNRVTKILTAGLAVDWEARTLALHALFPDRFKLPPWVAPSEKPKRKPKKASKQGNAKAGKKPVMTKDISAAQHRELERLIEIAKRNGIEAHDICIKALLNAITELN